MPYRLVICIDVEAESLKGAYGKVYEAMGQLPKGLDWESSDEAFDVDGEVIAPEEMQKARMAYLDPILEKQR